MSAKRTLGIGLAGLGALLVLAGLAMPATRPETARACYDVGTRYGQNCVETTYQAPTAKGPVLGGGFASLVAGAILWHVGRDAGPGSTPDRPNESERSVAGEPNRVGSRRDSATGTETLAERVERHGRDGGDPDGSSRPGATDAATATGGAAVTEAPAEPAESDHSGSVAAEAPQREPAADSGAIPDGLTVAGRSAAVAVVGGLVASSAAGLLVGTVSGGLAWAVYVATGLGTVALWRRRGGASASGEVTER